MPLPRPSSQLLIFNNYQSTSSNSASTTGLIILRSSSTRHDNLFHTHRLPLRPTFTASSRINHPGHHPVLPPPLALFISLHLIGCLWTLLSRLEKGDWSHIMSAITLGPTMSRLMYHVVLFRVLRLSWSRVSTTVGLAGNSWYIANHILEEAAQRREISNLPSVISTGDGPKV